MTTSGAVERGVSVVIPTLLRPTLPCALRAIASAAERIDEPVEVLVVDDRQGPATSSGPAEFALPGISVRVVRTIEAGVAGPSAARNLGIERARFDLIALTDDDAHCDQRWLEAGVARLRAEPEIAGVEGAVRVDAASPIDPLSSRIVMNLGGGGYLTASLFVRAEALAAVGGFRSLRTDSGAWAFPFREDSDIGLRIIRDVGPIPFEPDAIVYHPAEPISLSRLVRLGRFFVVDAAFVRLHPAACPPIWRRPLARLRIRLATVLVAALPGLLTRRTRAACAVAVLATGTAISAQFELELREAGLGRPWRTALLDTIRRVPRALLWATAAGSARIQGEVLVRLRLITIPES